MYNDGIVQRMERTAAGPGVEPLVRPVQGFHAVTLDIEARDWRVSVIVTEMTNYANGIIH